NIDIFAEREAKIFGRARIERVGQSNPQTISAQTDRKCAVKTSQSARNQFQNRGRNFLIAKIDIFGAERVGDGVIEAGFIDETAVHHRLDDSFAVQVRLVYDILGLRLLKDVLFV